MDGNSVVIMDGQKLVPLQAIQTQSIPTFEIGPLNDTGSCPPGGAAPPAPARGGVPVSSFAVVVACVVCFVLATPPWPVAYVT